MALETDKSECESQLHHLPKTFQPNSSSVESSEAKINNASQDRLGKKMCNHWYSPYVSAPLDYELPEDRGPVHVSMSWKLPELHQARATSTHFFYFFLSSATVFTLKRLFCIPKVYRNYSWGLPQRKVYFTPFWYFATMISIWSVVLYLDRIKSERIPNSFCHSDFYPQKIQEAGCRLCRGTWFY